MKKVANSIKDWIEIEETVKNIANEFEEFEIFQFDEFENPNPEIEERWKYVKNRIFNDTLFCKKKDWEERYFKMLDAAKRKEAWKSYFPYTSHYWLRFSLNSELTNTWELGLHIIPTWETEDGNYHVGVPESENKEGFTFKELDEAIEFYDFKLNEYQPINWK
jgi:hypothetical protein